jgi:uncharacterized membrane protein
MMNIVITILLVIAGIIALLLIIALLVKKQYYVQREIIIDAPVQKVFDYIRHLKNWDNFNKWAMADPDMKRTFKGTDGTVGFVYAWNGNKKAGEGEKEIKAIAEGKSFEWEIRFVRPFTAIGYTTMRTESIPGDQTKVTLSNTSKIKYPLNIMVPMVEKMLPKDMDTSLVNLKNILEK